MYYISRIRVNSSNLGELNPSRNEKPKPFLIGARKQQKRNCKRRKNL